MSLEIRNTPPLWLSMAAGGMAHSIEVLTLGHILDRFKIEREAYLEKKSSDSRIWKKEDLYRGFRWNLLSNGLKGSMGWTIHNICNRIALSVFPQKNSHSPSFSFMTGVGISAAICETSLILCPLERLKTLEMTEKSDKKLKINDLFQKNGFFFFYRGWGRMVIRQSVSWVSYLNAYRYLRQSYLSHGNTTSLSLDQKMKLGLMTGVVVAFVGAPFDLLKTQAQKAEAPQEKVYDSLKRIINQHGYMGLYRGFPMKLARTTWSSMVVLIILDRLGALPKNMEIS